MLSIGTAPLRVFLLLTLLAPLGQEVSSLYVSVAALKINLPAKLTLYQFSNIKQQTQPRKTRLI